MRNEINYNPGSSATTDSIVDQVNRQCELTPDATAIVDSDGACCYRDLNRQADLLALQLQHQGVSAGDRVGICLARGRQLGIAVLAVLKAGAAYVPLDPAYPRHRLNLIARDSDATVILASRQQRALFDQPERILAPDDGDLACRGDGSLTPAGPDPEQLAYIIYTSGSTGTPKGVAMSHRALLNLLRWQLAQDAYAGPARVLQFTPLGFDVHFQEFFATWASGGSLFFISDEQRRDPAALLAFIVKHQIERIFLPFVAMQHLLETAVSYGPMPESLREITTAGEQLQISPGIAAFFKQRPQCRLHNHYGPSETHVVTSYTLPHNPDTWPSLPPIGRPIDHTRIALLGADGKEVAAGERGEIHISGECLAQGYWQQPQLTAERFVARPDLCAGLLYRSGDLASQDRDGNLLYLGRVDGQVKIRGHRVETGEIEIIIKQQPEIADCAVIASGDSSNERKLLAYLVLDAKQSAANDLRQNQQLAQWRDIWDGTYRQAGSGVEPGFDISGWNSSFSSQALPAEEMRQWLDGTLARLRRCNPRRVLEIGAGTGLILFGLAPHCDYYLATDYSGAAIKQLQQQLAETAIPGAKLETSHLAANEIDSLAGEVYDTIIINSVSQHMVSVDYLIDVLAKACPLVSEGGHIFVGDVTGYRTRPLFFTELECHRAQPTDSTDELRARVQRRLGEEQELVLDPELFYRLADEIESIANVTVQLKPGSYDNELSRYRYDVILEIGKALPRRQPQHWLDWQPSLNFAHLLGQLQQAAEPCIAVRGIPNARLQYANALQHCLACDDYTDFAAAQTAAMAKCRAQAAVHPDELLALQDESPYRIHMFWSRDPAQFDVIIADSGQQVYFQPPAAMQVPIADYASRPYNMSALPAILSDLRHHLEQQLPDYMWPARYIPLQALPLTPSGKLDRRALPLPSTQRPTLEQEYVAPEGSIQMELAAIWAQLLELDQVGINDNFFELGGNSILSLRLGLEIRRRMKREVAVVTLFQYPTISSLAAHLDDKPQSSTNRASTARSRAKKQQQALARSRRPGRTSHQ